MKPQKQDKPKSARRKMSIRTERAIARLEQEHAILRAGGITSPENFFFIVQRKKRHKELHVPYIVSKECNFPVGENIQIRDEYNRGWQAKVCQWQDGRISLSEGWRAFCRWNYVQMDDWCICEVINPASEHDIYLKVRIVKAALMAEGSS